MYKRLLLFVTVIILLIPVSIRAEEGRVESSGEIKVGAQSIGNNDANSSKFKEYRDIREGFNIYKLNIEGVDTQTGRYLEFKGKDLIRDDKSIMFRIGGYGKWGIEVEWDETPHLLSNKAKTPYNYQGSGLYTVPTNAGATSITGASTAQDTSVSNYLSSYLRSTDLGTQREKGSVTLSYTPTASLKFRLGYSDERKEGTKITGAPLGERPPNTFDTQIAEPIDYQTRDLKFEAEYAGENIQMQVSYLLSKFENNVPSLTWQSMFYGPTGTNNYNNTIGRTVSTYGRTSLDPDNRYQNITFTLGVNLPLESRLAATASYGLMEQDETLLPYSYSTLTTDWNSTSKLPRTKSDAEIKTTMFNLDYTINPIDRLNLRAFYRYYNLDNNTWTSQWNYTTADTMTVAGHWSAPNHKRVNLAYAYDKQNFGLDANYSFSFATIGLGYEREDIERDFREADTEEDIFKGSVSLRPAKWLSLRAKYLHGERDADNYNYKAPNGSYWYTRADITADAEDGPVDNFVNSPDLRKYDVSDRKRDQWEISAVLKPLDTMDIPLSYMNRKDDFDSGVSPTTVAGYDGATGVSTPYNTLGRQLGLLEDKAKVYTAGINYAPTERLNLNVNYGREENESLQRGSGGSEDNKYNGSGWTDPAKLWEAKTKDKTNTVGAGMGFVIIKDKLNFAADSSYSYGTVDIDYSGYGSDKALNDSGGYAFNDPGKVSHKQYNLNANLEYQLLKGWVAGLGYLYDRYKIKDWMQEPSGTWNEQVGSEYFLKDTAGTSWGGRIVSMGSTLGPSYESHVGFVTLTYRW